MNKILVMLNINKQQHLNSYGKTVRKIHEIRAKWPSKCVYDPDYLSIFSQEK